VDGPGNTATHTKLGIGRLENGVHVRLTGDIRLDAFNGQTVIIPPVHNAPLFACFANIIIFKCKKICHVMQKRLFRAKALPLPLNKKEDVPMEKTRQVMPDIDILPAHFPVPGAGFLPVNAFVIKARDPVLVDTGMGVDSDEFIMALKSVIDPRDLKWIWLTHDDADHTGSLQKILELAPNARLAAYSLAVMRLSTAWPVPMDRVYWLNPGDSISAGDRKLIAVRPPLFDNPTTICAYDDTSGALFAADFFGAIIPSPAEDADDVGEENLSQGMIGWAAMDNPWIHMVDPNEFKKLLDRIRKINPKAIFSAHLPPSRGRTEKFLEWIGMVPSSTPAIAPNQEALEQMIAQMKSQG
jgi:glyoxylase-like metal-dependent hydrolase (beta-lactamase superfamily II)